VLVHEPGPASIDPSLPIRYPPAGPAVGDTRLERMWDHVPETPGPIALVPGAGLDEQNTQGAGESLQGKVYGTGKAGGSPTEDQHVGIGTGQRGLRTAGLPRRRRSMRTLSDQGWRRPAPVPSADSARSSASSIRASCNGAYASGQLSIESPTGRASSR
jgi:hypothetical protein